jgi:hypothetical protein
MKKTFIQKVFIAGGAGLVDDYFTDILLVVR